MSFLTGYVMPKKYYEEVGAEGFEAAPIGTGPYMVEKFERNAFVRLKANENYWGGAPEFKTVTIKFVTDAASRVAEVESGNSAMSHWKFLMRNLIVSKPKNGLEPVWPNRSRTLG